MLAPVSRQGAPLLKSLMKILKSDTPIEPRRTPTQDELLNQVEQPTPVDTAPAQDPSMVVEDVAPVDMAQEDALAPQALQTDGVDQTPLDPSAPAATRIDTAANDATPVEEIAPERIIPEDADAEEATQFMKTGIEGYDTTKSWQPNFKTIETDEDSQAVIAGLAEKYSGEIDEARRGVIHDEQLHEMAQELGADPKFIVKFLSREGGQAVNAETIIASRHILHESGRKLKEMAGLVMSGDASDNVKMDFHRQWDFHRQFMTQFMGARAEIGRAMRSYGVPLGSEKFKLARQAEVQGTHEQRFDLQEVAEQILNSNDFTGLNQIVQKQKGGMSKGGAAMVEWFVSSILSGVKTHIVNTSGNAIMTLMGPVETALATRMGRPVPDGMVAGEAQAQMFGLLSTFRSSMQVAWGVAKTGEPYRGTARFETPHPKAISGEALGLSGPWGFIADVTGTVVRAPLERVMGPIDGFFMHMNEGAKIAQLSYREAVHRRNTEGLTNDEFLSVLGEIINDPPQHIREASVDYGLYNMAATPLGDSGRKLQNAVNSNAAAKMIFPFIRTPINLVKMAFVDRSPLGLLSKKVREDISGKNGEDAARYARARMTFGSMMGASVTALAGGGMLTGAGPNDYNARRSMQDAGWQPNSFVITDDQGVKTYISYKRTEPIGYLIGTIADLYEVANASQYDAYDDLAFDEATAAVAMAIANNTVNATFMTGARDFMIALSPNNPNQEGDLRKFIARQASGLVPYSGLQRDLRKGIDPVMRQAFTISEKMRNNIPFLSEGLPARLDVFGEEVTYEQILSPWTVSIEGDDPILAHIGNLAEVSRGAVVGMPPKRIQGIQLNASEYHDYVNMSRNTVEINGDGFKDTLSIVFQTEEYQSLTLDAKIDVIGNIQGNYDSLARQEMLNPSNLKWSSLQARFKLKKISDAGKLGGEEAADAVQSGLESIGF